MKWALLLLLLALTWFVFLRPRLTPGDGEGTAASPTPTATPVSNPYKASLDRAREVADQVRKQHEESARDVR